MFDLSQTWNRSAIYCFGFCRGAWTGHRMALSFLQNYMERRRAM
jgi:hypothetical protein